MESESPINPRVFWRQPAVHELGHNQHGSLMSRDLRDVNLLKSYFLLSWNLLGANSSRNNLCILLGAVGWHFHDFSVHVSKLLLVNLSFRSLDFCAGIFHLPVFYTEAGSP